MVNDFMIERTKTMAKNNNLNYSASFTTGGLFFNETERVLDYILKGNIREQAKKIRESNVLQINSEASRKRVLYEIVKRVEYVNKDVWEFFDKCETNERKIILFYVCLKTYRFLFEFQSEVVLEKYRSLEYSISNEDVQNFIIKKSIDNPEIEQWSRDRRYKVGYSTLAILRQSGMVVANKITPFSASPDFWKFFVDKGDSWFLELSLLNKEQREQVFALDL